MGAPSFFLVIGLLLMAFGILGTLYLRLNRDFVTTMAAIVEKQEQPENGSYFVTVKFNGRRARVALGEDNWNLFYVGEAIAVYYDPKKPDTVYHGNRFSIGLVRALLRGCTLGGAVMAAAALRSLMK